MSRKSRRERPATGSPSNPYPYDELTHTPHLIAIRVDALSPSARTALGLWLQDGGMVCRTVTLTDGACAKYLQAARMHARKTSGTTAVIAAVLRVIGQFRPGTYDIFVCAYEADLIRAQLHLLLTGSHAGEMRELPRGERVFSFSPAVYAASRIGGTSVLFASGSVAMGVAGILGDAFVVTHQRAMLKAVVEGLLFAGTEVPPRWARIAISGGAGGPLPPSQMTRQWLAEAGEYNAGERIIAIAGAHGFTGIHVSAVPLAGPISIGKTWVLMLPPELDAHVADITLREALDLACMRLLMVIHGLPHPFQDAPEGWLEEAPRSSSH